MPFFSIIIPTYNREKTIIRAIDSILQQSFANFEIIVVDDGSDDATKEVVSSLYDNRIHYYYQANQGVCSARNYGASLASGDYLVFLDSDDYVTTNWLEDFNKIALFNNSDFVFCDMLRVDSDSGIEKLVRATYPYRDNRFSDYGLFMPGTFCVRPVFFKAIGGFDVTIKYGEFTEFGFKTFLKKPTKNFTNKLGVVYEASIDGGSKNLQNKIFSNLYIIDKHRWYFDENPHALRFYYQNIGVAHYKLLNTHMARLYLWKAFLVQPLKVITFFRLLTTFLPYSIIIKLKK
jgi:glycosyltransferase involved in cell wall biosynthesis